MTRPLAFTIAFFGFTLGLAHAVPVRPLYEPAQPATPPVVAVNLNGSAWLGKYNAANRVFIFEADGTLSYHSPAAKASKGIKNRGSWKLDGNRFSFEHFIQQGKTIMTFKGTVIDANTIVGEAIYVNGNKMQQTLKRRNDASN